MRTMNWSKSVRALSVALLGLAFSPLSHADKVDLNLSGDTFGARYTSPRFATNATVDADWLHHVDNGDVVGAGLLVEQVAGSRDTSLGLGGKVVGIFNDVDDAYAVALGGRVNAGVPGLPKVRLGAHAWVAPRVTSFNDARSYQDWGVRAGYQIMERGEVYVGYRYAKVRYDDAPSVRVSDDVNVGMELTF